MFDWAYYSLCDNGSWKALNKYNTNSSLGKVDNKYALDDSDDAAVKAWGDGWRMPTYDDWAELKSECDWTWTSQKGVSGYLIKSKKDQNVSMFLPAAGQGYKENYANAVGNGYYWSKSLYDINGANEKGFSCAFTKLNVDISYSFRYIGMCVRPVCKPN